MKEDSAMNSEAKNYETEVSMRTNNEDLEVEEGEESSPKNIADGRI